MTERFEDCWFLTGPTASGKTTIGLELAQRLGAEIISMDSMAIYREMDIGTAKPTRAQTERIPHHLIDIRDPSEDFSVANYVELANDCVAAIRSRGNVPLFVGGTPLYLKALLRGLFTGPPADWAFRREVKREVETVGIQALHQRLMQVDPLTASRLSPHDVRRIIRALEVYRVTGQPISHFQLQFDEGRPAESCRVFVLQWERAALLQRIEARVCSMFERGFLDEVQNLRRCYGTLSRTASQAVGYREVLGYLETADQELSEVVQRVVVRTRRFAKRQCTWFRSLSECRFVMRSTDDDTQHVMDTIAGAAQPDA